MATVTELGIKMVKTCQLSTVLPDNGGYAAPALVTEHGCSKVQKPDEHKTR